MVFGKDLGEIEDKLFPLFLLLFAWHTFKFDHVHVKGYSLQSLIRLVDRHRVLQSAGNLFDVSFTSTVIHKEVKDDQFIRVEEMLI